ncbi:MAG: FMN-binding negative transcriptional regulator [Ilumatobacteraceae bacterium]
MSPDDALSFAARSAIGHLTTLVGTTIESSVVPFVIHADPGSAILRGHLSAANRQVTSIDEGAEALLIVDGPVAYVSPGLYPTKMETGKVVPTLNYISVQLRGTLQPLSDDMEFRALLSTLTDRFETPQRNPWSINDAPEDYVRTQMKAIRGFSMRVEHVEGVGKYSQNRPDADQLSVRDAFCGGSDNERAIAEWMT